MQLDCLSASIKLHPPSTLHSNILLQIPFTQPPLYINEPTSQPGHQPNFTMTTAISFHHLALNPLLQGLRNVHHIISKGQAHAQAKSEDPNEYLTARLHPDMKDLIYQVQRFTDAAKFVPNRVNEKNEGITLPDTEKTFEECLARVEKVIKYLEGIEESSFEGREHEVSFMVYGMLRGSEWADAT